MKKFVLLVFFISFLVLLSGCVAILIGGGIAGINKACKVSNAHYKQHDLEAKEAYGKYRIEMQQKNLEPLSYEDWLKEQIKDPEKAKEWKCLLRDLGKNK